eukprot:Transcript_7218.p1 GENE.Transcript_7218~~Transcript_7218.p1  ORF type:complete len:455 (-),score=105.19 Transcript_7218:380-1744(-)
MSALSQMPVAPFTMLLFTCMSLPYVSAIEPLVKVEEAVAVLAHEVPEQQINQLAQGNDGVVMVPNHLAPIPEEEAQADGDLDLENAPIEEAIHEEANHVALSDAVGPPVLNDLGDVPIHHNNALQDPEHQLFAGLPLVDADIQPLDEAELPVQQASGGAQTTPFTAAAVANCEDRPLNSGGNNKKTSNKAGKRPLRQSTICTYVGNEPGSSAMHGRIGKRNLKKSKRSHDESMQRKIDAYFSRCDPSEVQAWAEAMAVAEQAEVVEAMAVTTGDEALAVAMAVGAETEVEPTAMEVAMEVEAEQDAATEEMEAESTSHDEVQNQAAAEAAVASLRGEFRHIAWTMCVVNAGTAFALWALSPEAARLAAMIMTNTRTIMNNYGNNVGGGNNAGMNNPAVDPGVNTGDDTNGGNNGDGLGTGGMVAGGTMTLASIFWYFLNAAAPYIPYQGRSRRQ